MLQYFWPSDDEQLAGQWQDSHFDEDGGFWANVQQCGAVFALATAVLLGSANTAAAQSVFSQSQDDPAGSLVVQQLAQDEYAQPLVAPVNWPQSSVFTDDDVHPTFVQVFTPDEDFWQNATPPVVDSNFVRLPFLDPEELPQFPVAVNPVDDSSVWAPNSPPWEPTWTLLFFLDDGSTVPIFQYDEDFLPVQALPVPYNWPQPAQPFAVGDETVPEFVAEDVFWPQYVPAVPDSLTWPQPFSFEQNEPSTLVSFSDEIFWQNPTAPVPDSLYVLRQDLFDDHVPAGSLALVIGDDGFRPDFVPPTPDSLRLLQQWPFDQLEPAGSLYFLRDEDFWQNPVAPVNWPQPSVFVFDEQPGHQPNTGQDEDFWNLLVPPVPATNYIRLPYGSGLSLSDPEEIPAGSLFPFVPPPVVPCVMPPGFDKDTNVSTFSSFKNGPIQVLLCRVCNSGRPLLVRGDYAIWCQDCCAFVSKQDTVMGTVRAPGQFRGRF